MKRAPKQIRIGDIFPHEGHTYECIKERKTKQGECARCGLNNAAEAVCSFRRFACRSDQREDKTDVYFRYIK